MYDIGINVVFVLDLSLSFGLGYYLFRNLKQTEQEMKIDMSSIAATTHGDHYFYSYLGYGVILWASIGLLVFVLPVFIWGILSPPSQGEGFTREDAFFTFSGFSAIIALIWLGFIEASIPSALVTERGIRNCSGLVTTFFVQWNEVESIRFNRWHHKYENWYTLKTKYGKITVRPRRGFEFFSEMVVKYVPEERWLGVRSAILSPQSQFRYPLERRKTFEPPKDQL